MTSNASSSAFQRVRAFALDPVEYTVLHPDGRLIPLTSCEYRLLHYLIMHAGRVLSAEQILAAVWRCNKSVASNLVPVYVRRLRTKLEPDPKQPRHIITVRGEGYSFTY